MATTAVQGQEPMMAYPEFQQQAKDTVGLEIRLLWYDLNIDSDEMVQDVKDVEEKGFSVKTFSDRFQAERFIKGRSSRERWCILTSGSGGKEFIPSIHDEDVVLAIAVFRMDVDQHSKWAIEHWKVRRVENTRSGLGKAACRLFCLMLTLGGLPAQRLLLRPFREMLKKELARDSISLPASLKAMHVGIAFKTGEEFVTFDRGYAVVDTNQDGAGPALMFRCCLAMLRSSTVESHDLKNTSIMNEVVRLGLKPHNEEGFKAAWLANAWSREGLEQTTLATLGQKCSLAYTSNFMYAEMNARLAAASVGDLKLFLGSWYKEWGQEREKLAHRGPKLFRGFSKGQVNLTDYAEGNVIYWPAMSSSTVDESIAERFAGPGGIVCEIDRCTDENFRHPDININENEAYGHYGSHEGEVLAFPFWSFRSMGQEVIQSGITRIKLQEQPSVYKLGKEDARRALDDYTKILYEDVMSILCKQEVPNKILQALKTSSDLKIKWQVRFICTEVAQILYYLISFTPIFDLIDVQVVFNSLWCRLGEAESTLFTATLVSKKLLSMLPDAVAENMIKVALMAMVKLLSFAVGQLLKKQLVEDVGC